jgi:uncharacterized membrane protein YeaQ/YmgE (transglycosylase-associated protein family)
MGILIWLSLGLIISVITIYFAPRNSSVLGTILLGMLGSSLGAVLASVIFNLERISLSLPTVFVALFLSATLVVLQRAIVKD